MSISSPSGLQKPKAILFDWDNTLVDSWAIIFDAINFTLESFDKETWTMEQTRQRVRKSLRDSFPTLFGDQWKKARDVFYGRYDEIHLTQLRPYEGANDMLAAFVGRGLYLGVVSSKHGGYLRKEAQHLGWDKHFSRLVGAMDAQKDKPAIDPVNMALSECAHERGLDIWFVGDADIDMECAINADLAPVLLRAEEPKPDEFKGHPPICHVADCLTLSKLVENM